MATRSPLAMPRATRPWATHSDRLSSSAKVRRSSPHTTASASPLSEQKARNKDGRLSGRLSTMARPSPSRPMTNLPPGPVTSASLSSNLRSRSVNMPVSALLCLSRWRPYEALSQKGEDLASRRVFTLHRLSRSRAVAGRVQHRPVRPALVQPCLPGRHLRRLLVFAEAGPKARLPDEPEARGRPRLLRGAGHHPRRPPWLCLVLQSWRLSS